MKRIITGHFGSGKTEIAMQMARDLAERNTDVVLLDLDVVNPYFTTSTHRASLEKDGVRIVSPCYANTNVDVPALTAGVRAALANPSCHAVVDLGGDLVGAAVLGSMADLLYKDEDVALLLAVNVYRPFTQTPASILGLMEQIEARTKMRVAGFINNANLLNETDIEHLYHGETVLTQVSNASGRPIYYHCGSAKVLLDCTKNLLGQPIRLYPQNKPFWL